MKELLKEFDQKHVDIFCDYIQRMKTEKSKDTGKLIAWWATDISDQKYAEYFRKVENEGLLLDGVHVTIQSTGLSYDYVAYKNRMLLAYPESTVDMALVFEGDDFTCEKESGKVLYRHVPKDPFNQKDDKIIGAYCVVKNKRGEFLTTISKDDLQKHRKVAKGDFIWKAWYKEMCLKTIIKKACKQHFADIYEQIEQEDNTQSDLELPVNIDLLWKQEIEEIETIEDLKKYWEENKGRGKEFAKLITSRKAFLTLTDETNEST